MYHFDDHRSQQSWDRATKGLKTNSWTNILQLIKLIGSISEFLRRETQMQRQQIASEWLLKCITLGLICLLHIASVHWKKKILETFNFVHTQFKHTIQIYDKDDPACSYSKRALEHHQHRKLKLCKLCKTEAARNTKLCNHKTTALKKQNWKKMSINYLVTKTLALCQGQSVLSALRACVITQGKQRVT